jgi:queuine tRNA-ribosyltransferase
LAIKYIFVLNFIIRMIYKIQKSDPKSKARTGQFITERGVINTPIFMPVGTAGTVKAIHQRELYQDIDAEIILGNTYHLYLRPGLEVLKNAGGLHSFINWDRPMLTDSGGYQVYSLAENRKINESGVTFHSHVDGSKHNFTPESVIDIQRTIGADIVMAFDECTPYPCDYRYAKDSMDMTHRWLKRCCNHFDKTTEKYGYKQTLFPIVQGSVYPDLRRISAEYIASFERDGNAIGGLSVGESAEAMYEMTEIVCDILPSDKPRYLMGVGTPENLLECISLGIDMFDCVMPTRNARNGMLFTSEGIVNIRNEKWKYDFTALDKNLGGYVSTYYTKAYLRHLILSKEILGAQIASLQNLSLYLWLVRQARLHIEKGNFVEWKNAMLAKVSRRL